MRVRVGVWARRAAAICVGALWAGGCANPATHYRGMTLHEDTVYVRGVAPILQGPDVACGPACLASVAAYWDQPVSNRKLHESLGETADHPAHSADELASAARAMGLKAYPYQGELANLDSNLEHGRPVIVLLRRPVLGELGELGMDGSLVERVAAEMLPKHNHWVVVVGADKAGVVVHDPALGLVRVDRKTFDSWWSDRARMALLVIPDSRESASLDPH